MRSREAPRFISMCEPGRRPPPPKAVGGRGQTYSFEFFGEFSTFLSGKEKAFLRPLGAQQPHSQDGGGETDKGGQFTPQAVGPGPKGGEAERGAAVLGRGGN